MTTMRCFIQTKRFEACLKSGYLDNKRTIAVMIFFPKILLLVLLLLLSMLFLLSRHSDFLVFALDALSNLKAIHMSSWRHQQNYLQNHLSSFLIQT
jgi:hypothetical protein